MNIYKLNDKEMSKYIKKFSKSIYGKTIMIHAYIVPIFMFLLTFVSALSICKYNIFFIWIFFYIVFPICILAILISFIIGNSYFYNQLKEYIKESSGK